MGNECVTPNWEEVSRMIEVREKEGMLPFKQFPEFGTVEVAMVPRTLNYRSAAYGTMEEQWRYLYMDQSAKIDELEEKIAYLKEWRENAEVSPLDEMEGEEASEDE
jgi:hypothetical protein